ncbi:MAG: threonine--tRNA ligase [Ardenticatenaceae bacterium]|nr:threonine--tRNA ligase [Ardenticatenaceae bacterium]MCB8987438.1 threonine--tRNA ligase [Ardenticatenaceae bacterium]
MLNGQDTAYEESDLYRLRHTAAHVLAQVVLELYPQAKLGIGPPIESGFYYDFDLGIDEQGQPRTFKPDDLPQLEKRMRQIIAGQHPLRCQEVTVDEARQKFSDQPYKLELIEGLEQGDGDESGETAVPITLYRHDNFEDLCRGPHVAHTGQIPLDGFKLMHTAAAYWRGDEKRPMLQRIYGTAWHSKKELKQYLHLLEEAKKRDHRKLGRELDLYVIDEEIGPGLPLWLPKGNVLREELEKLAREVEDKAGYQRVSTPHIAKEALYLHSGHLPYYAGDMYPPMDDEGTRYYLKPMNCPFHHKIFASRPRSYRELPLRLAEYGMVYRYEQSGALFGLMRVRAAQQNDAHIYCSEEQFEAEFIDVMDMYRAYFDLFGIDKYVMRLSKHSKDGLGKKYADNEAMWLKTEEMVRQAMKNARVPFVEAEDEAAFYGPKIDVQIWSAIGREFSLATNQVDFAQPANFDLVFVNERGEAERPLCIHRAPLGSHERFIGFLIEHYAGNFPVWLAPVQAVVIPITDKNLGYARRVTAVLKARGIRIEVNEGDERMNKKIRQAQLQKIPYMLVVGDQEESAGTVSVRTRLNEIRGSISLAQFQAQISDLVENRLNYL